MKGYVEGAPARLAGWNTELAAPRGACRLQGPSGELMHELSVAVELCRMAREHLKGKGATAAAVRLLAMGVEVGEDSGVDADNLQFCLEVLFQDPPLAGARVTLLRLPGDVLRLSYLEVDDVGPDH